jgi:predicted enzyme related to lactoylglutathione lyase
MANPFVHCELATTDVGQAKGFYGKLFDWKFDDMPMEGGTYSLIGVGEGTGGGLMKNPMPNAPSMWMPYVLVPDIKAATTKARLLGANICKDVTGGEGHGVVVDLHRSDRRHARLVAADEKGVTLCNGPCSTAPGRNTIAAGVLAFGDDDSTVRVVSRGGAGRGARCVLRRRRRVRLGRCARPYQREQYRAA